MEQFDILIFKTSIRKKKEIKQIASLLNTHPHIKHWSVDFEDWEKVLRIECKNMDTEDIKKLLATINIEALELEN